MLQYYKFQEGAPHPIERHDDNEVLAEDVEIHPEEPVDRRERRYAVEDKLASDAGEEMSDRDKLEQEQAAQVARQIAEGQKIQAQENAALNSGSQEKVHDADRANSSFEGEGEQAAAG